MAEIKKPAEYVEPEYTSQYQGRIDDALNKVANREEFAYDPLKDANYQAMAKVYQKQGEQAAKNTLGDAAALNGGFGSSFGVTASQQARNDFNQQLDSQIPGLQEAAFNKWMGNYNMDVSALGALQDAESMAYGKHRDSVGDSQWKYGNEYNAYRDDVGDDQWKQNYDRGVLESERTFNYQKSRDAVSDSQWAQEFAQQKKLAAASGGGSSSGGNYLGGYDGDGGLNQSLFNVASAVSAGTKAVKSAAKKTNKTVKKGGHR